MAYKIEPKSVKEFIDMDTALPRFQRKQTWNPKDNFKLCISVFKDYPIGVVIINSSDKYWVLDGRQRLNALTKINKNPLEVYEWARKFIKFKKNDPDDVVKTSYWDTIDDYLQRDFEEDVYGDKGYKSTSSDTNATEPDAEVDTDLDIDEAYVASVQETEATFNSTDQRNNLNILLNYILMVHGFSKNQSKFERIFDFRKVIKRLSYYDTVDGKETFIEEKLVDLIRSIIKIGKDQKIKDIVTKDLFVKYFVDERYFSSDDAPEFDKFKQLVNDNWSDIKNDFEIIDRVETALRNARVGIIEITQASDLDAQNMFSLVNTGGTLLTAEEILSAKPF